MSEKENIASKVFREQTENAIKTQAQDMGLDYVNIGLFPINTDLLKLVNKNDAFASESIIFSRNGKVLKIACVNPRNEKLHEISDKLEASGFSLLFHLCSKQGLLSAFELYNISSLQKKKQEFQDEIVETYVSETDRQKQIEELKKQAETLSAPEFLNRIQLLALAMHTSDIHLQPSLDEVVIRFRIDGVLQNICTINFKKAQEVVSHIKYSTGMKMNINNIPQDGGMVFWANKREIEVRASVIPTLTVESVVMRLLDSKKGIKTFSELGFDKFNEEQILFALQQKNGIVLVTGPTGSGKTTTLYSMLAELNTPERKIVTLEDPIEYHLKGITQSQVADDSDYNFETGFKSLLRHDPDVILVGEMRTLETTKLAFEAALTGHTVLSSLHTNSSIGAISRLRNMGVENFNIAPTINAVFAQKLVRKACPHCAKKVSFDYTQNEKIQKAFERLKSVRKDFNVPSEILKPVGCEECNFTGYNNQTAITEAFVLTDEVKKMILNNESEIQIKQYLNEKTNFLSLFEAGMIKVCEQITTLNEIQRVIS